MARNGLIKIGNTSTIIINYQKVYIMTNNTIQSTTGTDNDLDRDSLEFRGANVGLTQLYMDQLGDIDLARMVALKEIKQDKTAY